LALVAEDAAVYAREDITGMKNQEKSSTVEANPSSYFQALELISQSSIVGVEQIKEIYRNDRSLVRAMCFAPDALPVSIRSLLYLPASDVFMK
jgi:hypothetical protein